MKTLRQQVLNRLIDEALLDRTPTSRSTLGDDQVKQAIFATPAFQWTANLITTATTRLCIDGYDRRSVRSGIT